MTIYLPSSHLSAFRLNSIPPAFLMPNFLFDFLLSRLPFLQPVLLNAYSCLAVCFSFQPVHHLAL
jgi:hypothetical protein